MRKTEEQIEKRTTQTYKLGNLEIEEIGSGVWVLRNLVRLAFGNRGIVLDTPDDLKNVKALIDRVIADVEGKDKRG